MSLLLSLPFLAIMIGLLACGTSKTDTLPTPASNTSYDATTESIPGSSSLPLPEVGTEEGNAAPDFSFKLPDGSEQSTNMLAEQGKPVFLFFFTTG